MANEWSNAIKNKGETPRAKKPAPKAESKSRVSPSDKVAPDYSKTSPRKDTSKSAGNKVPGKAAVTSGKKEVGMSSAI